MIIDQRSCSSQSTPGASSLEYSTILRSSYLNGAQCDTPKCPFPAPSYTSQTCKRGPASIFCSGPGRCRAATSADGSTWRVSKPSSERPSCTQRYAISARADCSTYSSRVKQPLRSFEPTTRPAVGDGSYDSSWHTCATPTIEPVASIFNRPTAILPTSYNTPAAS